MNQNNKELIRLIEQWYFYNFIEHSYYANPEFDNIGINIDVNERHADQGGLSIIILSEFGLLYSNLVGGHACRTKVARGFLIHLPLTVNDKEVDCSGWWTGDAKRFFDVNPELNKYFEPNGEAEEAWIPVIIKGCNLEAILSYENCD